MRRLTGLIVTALAAILAASSPAFAEAAGAGPPFGDLELVQS